MLHFEPVGLQVVYLNFGYQCWISVMETQVTKFIVNVSSDLSCECTPELIRGFDASEILG